jgi:uncharacterized protein YabN with tetrapyrrole methylase and pyrophosphatase domain
MTKAQPSDAASTADAGARFARLVAIMQTLRSPDGCAWDREQTVASLRPFVLEEAYEVVEAMDRDDRAALCEELGDLLLEAVFVAQVCAEDGDFTIGDAAEAVTTKLIRRHPHVFAPPAASGGGAAPGDRAASGGGAVSPRGAGGRALSPAEVKRQWERIKREERAGAPDDRATLLDGIPEALPSLLRASRIGARAANVGFDWTEASEVVDKADEEIAELRGAIAEGDPARIEEELGDLLFTVANAARKLRIDPESALRTANAKFTRRFRAVEQRLEGRGRTLHDASSEELEHEWQAVKNADDAAAPPNDRP